MQPEIHLGPLTLQTFGIMFSLAFLAAGAVLARRLSELGKPPDWAYEVLFGGLIGGLVGARLYYVIQHWASVHDDLIGNIFSGSGLVWYGGALGGALGVVLVARRHNFLGLTLLDTTAPALALGYAIGRIGCQLSGDGDYGSGSSLPWAMSYPDGTVPTDERVHPTPVYETLAMGLVAWFLWTWRDRMQPGLLFATYLVLSGTERLLVEFVRRNDEVLLGLTAPQIQSIVLILAGGTWIVVARRRAPSAVTAG